LRVEILGFNRISDEAYNSLVARPLNVLPWLQDTREQDVWNRWAIDYRDVLILDAFNRPVGTYNLTANDLLSSARRQVLKQMLLDAAVIVDSDQDGLPDVWETFWFESLAQRPEDDFDGDGIDQRTEFAWASNPKDPLSGPLLKPIIVRPGGRPALAVTVRRFSGGGPTLVAETSSDLLNWSAEPSSIFRVGSLVNAYDGMGGGEARFQQSSAAGALPNGFVRVRAVAP
jgi:hypothetical protein